MARMIKGFVYVVIFLALLISAHVMRPVKTIRYLPLGDSYTIGTGASEETSWPRLLANDLTRNGLPCTLLANPARNGYSTQNLIDHELPLLKTHRPDFVTLLIGVNDWVRGVSKTVFEKNLALILNEIQKEIPDRKKILLLTIPDFGVTPEGRNYGNGRDIHQGIAEFNSLIQREARKRGLVVVDIFEVSKEMGRDSSLVARDGLHPSAKEYAIWERLVLPEALRLWK